MIRSRRHLRLAATTCLAVMALAPATSWAGEAAPVAASPAPESWGSFGVQTQWMDTSVRPGDDFDEFVNGKWKAATELPADKSRIGSFDTLNDLSRERLRAIVEGLANGKPRPGSNEARIADAYNAFLNTDAIDAAGLAPVQPYLQRINSVTTREQLIDLMAEPGFSAPFYSYIGTDSKNSDAYLVSMGQGGLGLPDRDYYLVDNPRFADIRARYLDYLTFMLGKAGYEKPRDAAVAVMRLETDMARVMWDRSASRNPDLTYNKTSMAEIATWPHGELLVRLIAKGSKGKATEVDFAQIPPTAEEIARYKLTPDYLAKIKGGVPETLRLLNDAPLATWQAWMAKSLMGSVAAVLPRDIDDANFAFYGQLLNGTPAQLPRWKRALATVERQLGELVGQIYAERYFPSQNKAAMDDMIANLRRAMAANLAQLSWMSPATREQAMAKLNSFMPKIGAPARFKQYEGLAISASSPLDNAMNAGRWALDYELNKLGKPVDRTEWGMLPQTINAYYNPGFNEIVFPAAILQPPFFNLTADPAVNYGAIGGVIGHEMGHGFDDQGAKSDEKGNLRDWWTPQDKANFEALQARLAAQYARHCPFDDGKTCINPQLTMGENIGDLGGLSLAYRAYRMSLNGKEAPVIDGMTGDQRFFMGWAQVWRAKAREAAARQLLIVDPHSPPHFRINGIVRNFDEWYKAFNVGPDAKMYLAPRDRVRIW